MQGLKHGMAYTKLYSVWGGMKTRCRNPNACNFMYYGGRGIDYCERWNIFENFYEDMGEVPEGMTLDRIDNDKGYYKENCKWSNKTEQRKNQRERKLGGSGFKHIQVVRQEFKTSIYLAYKVVIKPHKAKSFKSIEKAIEYRDLLKSSVNF